MTDNIVKMDKTLTKDSDYPRPPKEIGQAVSSAFVLFKRTYPMAFRKAFPTPQEEAVTIRIWASQLTHHTPKLIADAALHLSRNSKYLPALAELNEAAFDIALTGLPNPADAYNQAALGSYQDPARYNWTHPIVYHAARATGFHALTHQSRQQTWPVFERAYAILIQRIRDGEKLSAPVLTGIEQQVKKPLSTKELRSRLKKLRKELEL